jgi:hypothetical protein
MRLGFQTKTPPADICTESWNHQVQNQNRLAKSAQRHTFGALPTLREHRGKRRIWRLVASPATGRPWDTYRASRKRLGGCHHGQYKMKKQEVKIKDLPR